jgi:hypothetical protein
VSFTGGARSDWGDGDQNDRANKRRENRLRADHDFGALAR